MNTKLSCDYMGYKITYTDWTGFTIAKDNVNLKSGLKSLEECEKWIDKQLKTKFKRVSVLVEAVGYCNRKRGEPFAEAAATSAIGDNEVWVVNTGNKGKMLMKWVYIDTSANREKILAILAKEKEILAIERERAALMQDLTVLKAEDMVDG